MNKLLSLSALAATLLSAGSAQAYSVISVSGGTNTVSTSFSTSTMLSVEADLRNTQPIVIELSMDAGESVAFNALARNLIGLGFERMDLTLTGAQFSQLGSAGASFGSVATVSGAGPFASIKFNGPEYVEASLGDWFLDGSATDFVIQSISPQGTQAVTLNLTTAVPEPSSWVLLLAGVAGLGWARRRANA